MKFRLSQFRRSRSLEDAVVSHQRLSILIVLVAFFSLSAGWSGLANTFDYSVRPKPNDNFLEASFRFKSLPSNGSSNTLLVYVPGTDGDGRDITADPNFLKIAVACNANLLGCYYRGKELSYDN